jgi:hypothetical protein
MLLTENLKSSDKKPEADSGALENPGKTSGK